MSPDDIPPPARLDLEPGDLDGHTIEELSDYLDAGRLPPDPTIENSPGCQLALEAMARLQVLSHTVLEADVRVAPALSESWVGAILDSIARDARAGRSIPLRHPSASAELAITEGAVRGIIRAAETEVDGVIIGRCRLEGDVTAEGEPITVKVDASVLWGQPIPATATRLRAAIAGRLRKHTDLTIAGIDITIHDLHQNPPGTEAEQK